MHAHICALSFICICFCTHAVITCWGQRRPESVVFSHTVGPELKCKYVGRQALLLEPENKDLYIIGKCLSVSYTYWCKATGLGADQEQVYTYDSRSKPVPTRPLLMLSLTLFPSPKYLDFCWYVAKWEIRGNRSSYYSWYSTYLLHSRFKTLIYTPLKPCLNF